jgi:hypothetical protein
VVEIDAPLVSPRAAEEHTAAGASSRFAHLPHLIAAVAALLLVAGTIGPPLVGQGTFLGSDALTGAYPWRATADPLAENFAHHGPIGDTIDGVFPLRSRFAEAARHGDFLAWTPFAVGGTTLGADGSSATMSPFELLYVLLPAWFAPAAIKLVQMAAAIGFTFLFCRRLGVGRVPASFGGLAFAGSGFMVMWTNWPHPEVAAFIPALFWATERFLQRPSVRAALPIALAMAVMLSGNFPALVLHALYVLVPYVLVRVTLAHGQTVRRAVGVLAGSGAAMVTGVLLVAVVLIPFVLRLRYIGTETRSQNPMLKLGVDTLLTSVAPKSLGLSTEGPDAQYFGPYNQIETIAFAGVTTALLAVVALALPRIRSTARGAREVLALGTVVIGWATFVGGDVLAQLQRLPGFEESFVGRTRAILGFMVAVLAALGLQALVERRWPVGSRQWAWAAAVLAAAGLTAAYAGNRALWRARGADQVDVLREGLVLPAVIAAAAIIALLLVRFGGRQVAAVALAAVPLLLVVESLNLSLPLLPNEDRSSVYPTTPGTDFLAAHVGDDRIAVQDLTLFGSGTSMYGLRRVTGHAFHSPTWKDAVLAVDPDAFSRSQTFGFLAGTNEVVTSSVLDRLGAHWFAGTPGSLPVGERDGFAAQDATCDATTTLRDEVTVSVPASGGLRGLVLRVCEPAQLPADAAIVVEVAGASSPARLPLIEAVGPGELAVAVPAEGLTGAGAADVRLSLTGADDSDLTLATTADGRLVADAVRPADDGLRLSYVDDLVIYERTRALPRIRWAGEATVVTDGAERLDQLSGGDVPDDVVILSDDAQRGSGDEAAVEVDLDAPTSIAVEVDANGDGFLVVADALQHGWVAEIDGQRVDLLEADHAGVAVHVPEGRHIVTFRYRPPGQRAGLAVSALSALALAGAWLWSGRRWGQHNGDDGSIDRHSRMSRSRPTSADVAWPRT